MRQAHIVESHVGVGVGFGAPKAALLKDDGNTVVVKIVYYLQQSTTIYMFLSISIMRPFLGIGKSLGFSFFSIRVLFLQAVPVSVMAMVPEGP